LVIDQESLHDARSTEYKNNTDWSCFEHVSTLTNLRISLVHVGLI